jgi:hypothetical protein
MLVILTCFVCLTTTIVTSNVQCTSELNVARCPFTVAQLSLLVYGFVSRCADMHRDEG